MIKKLIILYQSICLVLATLLLLLYTIKYSFEWVVVIAMLLNVFIGYAIFKYHSKNDSNLFILSQAIQIFGIGVYGIYFFMHSALFIGPVFFYESEILGVNFDYALPEYAFKYIKENYTIGISINLLPIAIIYWIEKCDKEKA